jgi:hypothetical protein
MSVATAEKFGQGVFPMRGLWRVLALSAVLGVALSFAGLRLATPAAQADSAASIACGTGNNQFQTCTLTLNVAVGAGGSFTLTLIVGGAQFLGCSSIPAGTPCSRTNNTATFNCIAGCAAGSQYQDVVSGPAGAGSQQTISIAAVPAVNFGVSPVNFFGANTFGSYGFPFSGGVSSCFFTVFACGITSSVGCGVSFISTSGCGFGCGGFFFNGCNFNNNNCLGFIIQNIFCPNNCTVGLFCATGTNNFQCINGTTANCSLPNPLCVQFTITNGQVTMTKVC